MEPVYILVAVALTVAVLWLLTRRASAPQAPLTDGAPRKTPRLHEPETSEAGGEDEAYEAEERGDEDEDHPAPPQRKDAPESKEGGRSRNVTGLRTGIAKMRASGGFFGRLKDLLGGTKALDPRLVEEIEEILITSDVGAKTTEQLLAAVRAELRAKDLNDTGRVWSALRARAVELLDVPGGGALREAKPVTVVMLVGVNGAGKTTTVGKLATKLDRLGRKVLLVAGDTFRAAAVQQIQAWGDRTHCEVFAGKEGADPASVVYDAIQHATQQGFDVVLCDTAGRLHTKSPLMDELRKVHKTAQKVVPGAPHEVLLVVDGTSGQNAVQQAAEFGSALPLTGIVLTKLDGTAKGGVVLAIAHERKLPVRYVGVGERAEDLREFVADEFVEALLGAADSVSDSK